MDKLRVNTQILQSAVIDIMYDGGRLWYVLQTRGVSNLEGITTFSWRLHNELVFNNWRFFGVGWGMAKLVLTNN